MREKYLDLGTLNVLRDLEQDLNRELEKPISGEGRSILQEVLEMYLDLAPVEIDRMSRVLARGDFEALLDEAHQLKSNSSMIGAVMVADYARMMEEYLHQTSEAIGAERDPVYLAHLLTRTKIHVEKTCALLRVELKKVLDLLDRAHHAARLHAEERGIV